MADQNPNISDLKKIVRKRLSNVRNLMDQNDIEGAQTLLLEIQQIIQSFEETNRIWFPMHDVFYHNCILYQLMGDTRKCLNSLLSSYAEEVRRRNILHERTRGYRMLKLLFNATNDFLAEFADEVRRQPDYGVDHSWLIVIQGFRNRLPQKLIFNISLALRAFQREIDLASDKVRELIEREKVIANLSNRLFVFKRWNSITPEYPPFLGLSSQSTTDRTAREHEIIGGGYYLVWNGFGIVIDPGFGFLKQLFQNDYKFGLEDISCIIVTHAHDDHCHEVESIYSLNSKWEKTNCTKNIPFIGSEGVVTKYSRLLSGNNAQTKILTVGNSTSSRKQLEIDEMIPCNDSIKIKWTQTTHHELPWMDVNTGVAMRFELSDEKGKFILGITGDGQYGNTDHRRKMRKLLRGCDTLLVHVGSHRGGGNHLGLKAAGELIGKTKSKLAILTEFGVEFANKREKARKFVIEYMEAVYTGIDSPPIILVGDSDLEMSIPEMKIRLTNHPNRWKLYNQIITREEQANLEGRVCYRMVYSC